MSDNSSSELISTVERIRMLLAVCWGSPSVCIVSSSVGWVEKMSELSFPPNPKELQRTFSSLTFSMPVQGIIPFSICFSQPRLAGMKWCCMASRQMIASMLPEALVVCPVNDFVLEIQGIFLPNNRLRDSDSLWSLLGVPVPCAFTYWMSSGSMCAIFKASFIAKKAPSPFSDEAVWWYASQALP